MRTLISIVSIIICSGIVILINEIFSPAIIAKYPLFTGVLTIIVALGISWIIARRLNK
jgi:hypothetical protein